jgi:hypothetical protein
MTNSHKSQSEKPATGSGREKLGTNRGQEKRGKNATKRKKRYSNDEYNEGE